MHFNNFVIFCAFNTTMSLINEELVPDLNEYFCIMLSLVNSSQKLLSKFGSIHFISTPKITRSCFFSFLTEFVSRTILIIAIPVEFSREGYKIRKAFGYSKEILKFVHWCSGEKVPKFDFQSQFSMPKIILIFLNFFSLKNVNLGAHVLLLTF